MKAVDIVGKNVRGDDVLPYMVEVKLLGEPRDSFLKIRETLTRIGIASRAEENLLFQSCHILQKKGLYYVLHYKTLFVLDGRDNGLTVGDIARQNRIVRLLEDWGLIEIVNPDMIDEPISSLANIKVVRHGDKHKWILERKYALGKAQ